jgi:dethiobiotin synthetase
LKTIFVTGTDTDVGKTYVSSLLARTMVHRGIRVGVYKPVASGGVRQNVSAESESLESGARLVSEDAVSLWRAAGKPLTLDDVCPQCFELPLAPDEAARRAGRFVDPELLYEGANRWRGQADVLLIEGAGGLFSPLADQILNIDLLRRWPNASLFLVAANRLGVLHQVIATCRAAAYSGVNVDTLFLSEPIASGDASRQSNAKQLRMLCPDLPIVPVTHGQNELTLGEFF